MPDASPVFLSRVQQLRLSSSSLAGQLWPPPTTKFKPPPFRMTAFFPEQLRTTFLATPYLFLLCFISAQPMNRWLLLLFLAAIGHHEPPSATTFKLGRPPNHPCVAGVPAQPRNRRNRPIPCFIPVSELVAQMLPSIPAILDRRESSPTSQDHPQPPFFPLVSWVCLKTAGTCSISRVPCFGLVCETGCLSCRAPIF